MTIQDRHITTLLNAKCKVVCSADTILKKMSYGEDVGCCIDNLWLASKLINRLECYCFGTNSEVEILSEYTLTIPNNNFPIDTAVFIKVNGVQVSYVFLEDASYKPDVIIDLLDKANISYTYAVVGGTTVFYITASCGTTSIAGYNITNKVVGVLNATANVNGQCANICNNCITDTQLSKMYEVLNSLLK